MEEGHRVAVSKVFFLMTDTSAAEREKSLGNARGEVLGAGWSLFS